MNPARIAALQWFSPPYGNICTINAAPPGEEVVDMILDGDLRLARTEYGYTFYVLTDQGRARLEDTEVPRLDARERMERQRRAFP